MVIIPTEVEKFPKDHQSSEGKMSESIFIPIAADALNRMSERYGADGDPKKKENRHLGDDWHAYHNGDHARGVAENGMRIAASFGCPPLEAYLAYVAGTFHDLGRVWSEKTDSDGCAIRAPSLIDEETSVYLFTMSANPIRSAFKMDETKGCDERWHQAFDRDVVTVISAIMATKCVYGRHGLEQPLLVPGVHPVVRAVALADFYSAALAATQEERRAAARVGDRLFRERHIGLQRILRSLKSRSEFPERMIDIYHRRILDFTKDGQLPFLKANQGRLLNALGEFSRESDVLSLLDQDNVAAVHNLVADTLVNRRDMDFWTLLEDVGYVTPVE